jgi:aryl sulfotransferase
VRSWWEIRHLPNLLMVRFADLRRDPEREIRRIAARLGITPTNWTRILEHTNFDDLKRHAPAVTPLGGSLWVGGAATFINEGTNGRWRDVLAAEESAAYEARAEAELGLACARWLAGGAAAAASLPVADEFATAPA